MKNRRKKTSVFRRIILGVNLVMLAVLAVGAIIGNGYQYTQETWRDALNGKTYVETAVFQDLASDAVYNSIGALARTSRMERAGEFDPDRIIRIRDYLDSRTVYDEVSGEEKEDGICYRLGDLYQWSLKGTTIRDNVLQEVYQPLFYGSIQEYANQCGEEYQELVDQIQEAMERLKEDVAAYQQDLKTWNSGVTNVRFALWDLGSGEFYTNVAELEKTEPAQESLEAYFKDFGSYYIFDSRSTSVSQVNVGDYYSYNTQALLTGGAARLDGEYQLYVGIDTSFPVSDQFQRGQIEYENAVGTIIPYMKGMGVLAVIWLVTLPALLVTLIRGARRLGTALLERVHVAVRIAIYFVAYQLIQMLIRLLPGTGAAEDVLMLILNAGVLAILILDGIQRQKLLEGVESMKSGREESGIPTEHLFWNNRRMAEAVNGLGEDLKSAVQEQMKSERMKADLITNVSHDLKTPLTSIINYVDLMKREPIENTRAEEYLEVLDQKSQRLKQLTEDLVEASRASSGNVTLQITRIDLKELLMQTSGEFEERFAARGLKFVASYPQGPLYVKADGRRLWRIIENLYRNVEKYAMPHTRVYLDVAREEGEAVVSMKNISEQPLNISAEELTERFTRGDESRTTEGSGLGLSIAKDLTELQNGRFEIYLDGDLFKVTVAFPCDMEKE